MILLCPWITLLVPVISAYLCCLTLSRRQGKRFFFLCASVLWVILSILPVQCLGVLEMVKLISQVTVPELALFQLLILAGTVTVFCAFRHLGKLSVQESAVETHEILPFYLKLSIAIVAASYVLFAIDLGTSLPKGSDALSYHIPLALRWLQEGSLRVPTDKAWQFSGPGNGEIIQMLALATRRQSLAPLGSLLSSLVLAIAAYPLAVKFGGGTKAPALAAILVVFTIPMIEFQTFSAYVDLFGVAFLFAAVTLFGYRYGSRSAVAAEVKTAQVPSLSWNAVAFSALACGLSLGTKLTFIPYCVLFVGTTIFILWRERRIHNKPLALLISVVLIGVLSPSGFWYARNLQATGNPLYPMPVALGRRAIFPGFEAVAPNARNLLINEPPGGLSNHGDRKYVRRRSEWWIYPWTEFLSNAGSFPVVYGEASGLGGAFATFVVVGFGFAVYQCLGISRSKPAEITPVLMLLWLALFLVWVLAMHRVLRFGLPLWVFACLLSAPAFALLMKAYPRGSAILFVCAISTTCAISSLVPFHDLVGHLLAGNWSRSAVYNYPAFIDSLPEGTCILNDSLLPEKDFALAGNRLTNKVVTAYEAPRELTQDFVSSRNINYVVQINDAKHSSPSALPPSVPAIEVFRFTLQEKVWRIWKIGGSR